MSTEPKLLIYGFGNPGRQDDGLGNEFIRKIEQWIEKNQLTGISCDSNYQLNIEDALEISQYEVVVFADATVEEHVETFRLDVLDPEKEIVKYTLHAASPGYILELCQDMYGKHPRTYLLRMKGYAWELAEGLTPEAQRNLEAAFEHFIRVYPEL